MALFNETPLGQIVREQATGQTDPYLRRQTDSLAGTAFQRGIDQSLGLGADYFGTLAEAGGQQPLAQDLYDYADTQMREAQLKQAGPQTTGDVQGLGSAADFVVNKAAESLPVSATAISAAALTRGRSLPTQLAAGGAAVLPVTAGETSYSMRQDEHSTADPFERAIASTTAGAAGAALEVLPEVRALGKLVTAAPGPAKTMAEAIMSGVGEAGKNIALEGVTEGAQDIISRGAQSQFNEAIGVNPLTSEDARSSLIESVAAGAAGGTAFGVPAGIATTLQQLPETNIEAPSGEQLRQYIGDVLTPRADRIPPSEIPANIDDAVEQEFNRENRVTERMRSILDTLRNRQDLTPEERATLDTEVDLDPDAQDAVMSLADRKAADDAARASIDALPAEGRASRVNPEVPLEEVDAIVQQAGIQAESASPAIRQWLSAYEPIIQRGEFDQRVINSALDIFGERGYSVLRAMAGDNAAARQAIDEDQASNGRLDDFLFQALKPEYRATIRPGQLRQLGNLVRGAAERGEGNLSEILTTAFQNPDEVVAAVGAGSGAYNPGNAVIEAQAPTQEGEEGQDVEFGDTGSVQDVTTRYFGDTRGNRRIKTGGLNIPLPVFADDISKTIPLVRNTEGMTANSDATFVPAVSTLRRLGVDPADVAAEIGVSPEDLRQMVFLQANEAASVDPTETFVRRTKNSAAQMNAAQQDPSAGSYLGIKDTDGKGAVIDVRRMVASKVYGNRQPAALLEAMSDGISRALSDGYTLSDGLPDNLVLARYGRGSDEQVVTLGDARKAVGKRAAGSAEGNMPLDPASFKALEDEGYHPKVDFTTGEMYLPAKEAMEIIDRYAAAVASRNATRRNATLPEWTQKLIDKHGTDYPQTFGTLRQNDSVIRQIVDWAAESGQDSKALTAVSGRKPYADVAEQRRKKAEERQGPAMSGSVMDESVLAEARARGIGLDSKGRAIEERENLTQDVEAVQTELGVSELDPEQLPSGMVEQLTKSPVTRTPEKPYMVQGGVKITDYFTTASMTKQKVTEQMWSTGTLPSGVDLQGVYAVLGKIASRGQPLHTVFAVKRGEKADDNVKKLMEAYQRRGFTIRAYNEMAPGVPVQDSPYSQRTMARVMGPTADSPAHVVLTIGETQSSKLARSLGIPVIDLTNPVQQKIAGDILRSYDSYRRQQISRSDEPAEVKAFKRKGEERVGVQRDRDLFEANMEKAIASSVYDPQRTDALLRVMGLAARVDDDFFMAGIAGRDISQLAATIDQLESYEQEYASEKFSLTRPGTERTASEQQFEDAREYIAKVLPPNVRVVVRSMSTMSGMYTETKDAETGEIIDEFIHLSAYAMDPLSTAHHESMHALIAQLRGQPEQAPFIKAMLKAADSPLVISRLRALLADQPAALEQMVSDPEERIAYMYEFWAAGKLNLTPSVENWMVKLVQTIRGIFGILSNNQKAELYMTSFQNGQLRDPSAVNSVVMSSLSTPERALRALPMAKKLERIADKVVGTAHGRLKSYGNPALTRIADAFYADSSVGGQRSGYLQTVRDIVNLYGSQFADIIRGSDEQSLNELAGYLHSNKRPRDPEMAEMYDQTKALLRRLYNYMQTSGIDLPKTNDYFPQAWDKAAVLDNKEEFIQMLVDNAQYRTASGAKVDFDQATATEAWENMISNEGQFEPKEDLVGFSPYMEASNQRTIILKDRSQALEFMDHDLVRIMTRYITQASKRGEYTRHFGQDGQRLIGWLEEAVDYGITPQELQRDVAPAIKAMEGTLGADISPTTKGLMSGIVTWQNLAVLPLAVFSSLIDPMGIVVRGGTAEQAWDAFKAGIKNIPQSLKKNGSKLDIQVLAETIGTVESQNVLDMLGDMYGSAYMTDWARKTNNLMFRYNLMEGWNTAMRSAATVAALDFIQRHAQNPEKNSKRWLDELGVSADMLRFDEDGKLLWRQADIADSLLRDGGDVTKAAELSRRTREAITRWVDGAVLRPHAAHRPAWASDPHFMLLWHLKQFTYSFQKTILERVMHEARNGNYNPAMALAAYVPFMIAADWLRGLVQGGGEEPDWKKDMTFGETVWSGVQRAGLLGVRQFAIDGAENPAFVLGPTAGYAYDAVKLTADGEVGDAIIQGLPGNALWKGW